MGIYTKTKDVEIGIEWSDITRESQLGILKMLDMTEEEFVEFYKADQAGVSIATMDATREEPFSISEFVDAWFDEADINGGKNIYQFSEDDLRDFKIDLIKHLMEYYMDG